MSNLAKSADSFSEGEKLLQDLEAMIPTLRERSAAAEEAARLPDETIKDLEEIGAFRAVVPKIYGGMEVEYPIIPHIFRTLGRGCTSTSWCMGFLIYHNAQFAHFPKQAQDEVWGDRGYALAPGQVMPSGKAVPVKGGYQLSGRWGYATGILHGDWILLSAPVENGGGQPEFRRFFVPVDDCEVLDTWHVSAMQATGSRDVELTDVFVPEHRQILAEDLRELRSPGMKIHTGPLWRIPFMTFMVFGAVGSLVGGAEAMLEIVGDILKTKVGAYSGDRQQALMSQRVRMARLKIELEATIGLYEDSVDDVWKTTLRGDTLTREERLKMRMVVCHLAKKSHEIVDELALVAGSRGTFLASPVQRFHRNINSLATHAIYDFDHIGNLYGGTMLDVEIPANAMI